MKSEVTMYESSPCPQPCCDVPTVWNDLILRALSVSLAGLPWALASCPLPAHHRPCPVTSEANRQGLAGLLASRTASHRSASAERAPAVACTLEPLPCCPRRPLCPPALPPRPSAQRSRDSRWLPVTSREAFWVGSPCLHLLPGLAKDDACKPLPAPKIPVLPAGPARKCLAH